MDRKQPAWINRPAVWSVLQACTRLCISPLLVVAACTAEITGGQVPPDAESQAFAGAAAKETSGPGAGASGAAASPPASNVNLEPRSMAEAGSAAPSDPSASSLPNMGDAGAAAPTTMNTAGAGGQQDEPEAGNAGEGSADDPAAGGADAMTEEPEPATDPEMADELVPGGVRWLGRVDDRDPDAARFSWAGSGFTAVLSGPTLSVRLTSQGSSVFYQSVIDGVPEERFEVKTGDHTVTLASGLSDAEHTVEVYRDTEGDGPISVFRGFEAGTLLGAPRGSGRFIEVVGDSISAGYGSLGSERHGGAASAGCSANAGNSSWFHTYSAVAARLLDAEVSTLARSGFGMVRGYGQNMNVMPPLFDDTIAGSNNPRWDFEHKPQAVIINLGTNDWNGGDPGTAYESAYIDFVTEVRDVYPDAWILLTVGSSLEPSGARQCITRLGHIVDARRQAGDDKIDSFDIGLQDSSMTGCGWHPNADEHMRMGNVLADELRSRLNW